MRENYLKHLKVKFIILGSDHVGYVNTALTIGVDNSHKQIVIGLKSYL